jgi:hypothetical protein
VKRLVACSVVALLAVAGCSAVPGLGGDVTPPGVENGELTNESALLSAHVDARGDSYVVRNTYEETAGNTTTTDEERLVVADDGIYAHRETTMDGSTSVYEAVQNESFSASRLPDGSVRVGSRYGPGGDHGVARQYDLLRLADFQTTGTATHDGQRVARLRADSLVEDAAVDFELASATMLVAGDGVVRELDYTLSNYLGSDEFRYESTTDPGAVDALPSPDWTSRARDELPSADLDVSVNGEGYLVVEHAGGDTFDARIRVDDQLFTRADFEAGQKLFVGQEGDGYELATMWVGEPVDGTITVTVTGTVSPERVTVDAGD